MAIFINNLMVADTQNKYKSLKDYTLKNRGKSSSYRTSNRMLILSVENSYLTFIPALGKIPRNAAQPMHATIFIIRLKAFDNPDANACGNFMFLTIHHLEEKHESIGAW
jgi:hypothetical protein